MNGDHQDTDGVMTMAEYSGAIIFGLALVAAAVIGIANNPPPPKGDIHVADINGHEVYCDYTDRTKCHYE